MQYYYYFFLLLLSSSFLLFSQSTSVQTSSAPAGTLERTSKQQVIASIPPGASVPPEPFLTSPSGKYAAYFLRAETGPGAGGFGNDFCYIQVQEASTEEGGAVWESECTPVSTANTCALAFSDNGLEIYDGSTLQWDNSAESADNNPLETLELLDEGDMRLRDKTGELAWRASEDPRVNQRCGAPGSPGLAPAMPPFAHPIGGTTNTPFGQQQQGQGQASGTFGFSNRQPLMDNSPFDSGSRRTTVELPWFGMGVAVLVTLLGFGFAEFY